MLGRAVVGDGWQQWPAQMLVVVRRGKGKERREVRGAGKQVVTILLIPSSEPGRIASLQCLLATGGLFGNHDLSWYSTVKEGHESSYVC